MMRTFAPSTNGDEGDNISKGLCHGITQITNRRLAFENNVRERAASRPLSPSRQANHTTHVEATEAAHNTSMLLEDYSLLVMRIEGRVTYMKLKGDQQLHLAEMARQESGVSTPECEGLAAEALESYLAAKQEASALTDTMTNASGSNSNNDRSKNNVSGDSNHRGGSGGTALPELHPLQVELSLRISSVLLYLLDRPVEAWEAGYPTYLAAAEQPTRLGARGLAITQALRDHLARVDVREIDEGYQHECGTDKKNAVIHGQCAREQPVEPCDGEWGFLRVFAGVNVAVGDSSEIGPTASDRLRALAQVKQARACLEGVTPTTRVLLGTMKHADAVRLALQQIFEVYAQKYAVSVQHLSDDTHGNPDKHVRLLGRKPTPQARLRQGPFLSWHGFEAICRDFNIAPAATPTGSRASRHLHPLANRRQRQRHSSGSNRQRRGVLEDHQRSPRTSPGPPAAAVTPQRGSGPRVFFSQTRGNGLLSGVQARIAFVSACTHGSVVASFPSDGSWSGNNGGDGRGSNGRVGDSSVPDSAGSAGRSEMISGSKAAAYWRDMERVVLAGYAQDDDTPHSLNFGQFVDALARCGLIGFPRGIGSATSAAAAGSGDSANRLHGIKRFVSPAERTQAMFVETMGLLDRENVDANLRRQESGAAEGGEAEEGALARGGENPNRTTTTVGKKKKGQRGQDMGRDRHEDGLPRKGQNERKLDSTKPWRTARATREEQGRVRGV